MSEKLRVGILGGTGMVGDPSGRTDMRQMMTKETINHNVECFKKQMSRFIDFSDGKAMLVNNADWLLDLNYVELLREVGACFSVNNMLRAECYKQRMEKGLSFLEFNYMIMQSYDFYELYQKYGCNMQFGGNDQWSNMLGGTELIRRKLGKDAHAMTITLLLNSGSSINSFPTRSEKKAPIRIPANVHGTVIFSMSNKEISKPDNILSRATVAADIGLAVIACCDAITAIPRGRSGRIFVSVATSAITGKTE